MTPKACDLHTHSCYSDGTYTPAELILAAERLGLSAIALCDHNTVAGLPEFLISAEGHAVEAIAGVELSTDLAHDGIVSELHILALYLPKSAYGGVISLVEDMKKKKVESNLLLVSNLQKAGYEIDYGEIVTRTKGIPNRAHIAKVLCEKGYVASEREAFATLLRKGGGFYIEPSRPDVFFVLDFIRASGAVSVLAHPFLNLDENALRSFLPKAKAHGLVAMETRYPLYDEKTTALAAKIAEENSLLPSGGSDFHGENKPDLALGKGRGELFVPVSFAKTLRSRANLG